MEAIHGELLGGFRERFGRAPVVGARAPGRVNWIGEHTDYQEGLVLPSAIDRDTWVLAAPRPGRHFRVWTRDLDEAGAFDVADLEGERRGEGPAGWLDYVKGVVFALRERELDVAGFDLAIASSLPLGSGLSSSAALEVAVATLLDGALGLGLGPEGCARVAHRGEQRYVGVACGILDPFACALGRADHALRIDCRSQEVRPIAVPPGRVALLIAHSGVTRELAASAYGDRVAECRAAVLAARQAGLVPGAGALRDLSPDDLPALAGVLEPTLLRRARHVITENARVDAFCAALGRADLEAAGALLVEGQRSLAEDYEVSIPEIDALCADAAELPGVYGSRLTGAGFGGCTLHLVAPEAAAEVSSALAARFERRFGRTPSILEARPSDGASFVSL